MKHLTTAAQILTTLAFLSLGIAKLIGAGMMVDAFETLGYGQWARYVTGLIEILAALMLWFGGLQRVGAALLFCTSVGAVVAHVLILGPSPIPAAILGVLSAFLLVRFRR